MKLSRWLDDARYMQYLSAIVATMSMTSAAMYLAWPSPALPQLTSDNSPIGTTISASEGSWVASSFLLGTIPGSFLAAWLVEKFGRKHSLLMSAVPLTIPWIVIIFAKSALILCIVRFIGGIGLAVVTTSASMYNGEIAENDIRGIKSLQQLSGITAIEAYMQTIISSTESSISPEISSIIAGVVQLPAALLSAVLVDRMGRKPLMIISALGCAIALIAEGVYFYLQNVIEADVSAISWLPTTALLLFLVMNPLGLFTLPWVLLGELFATNIKGIAVSAATFYGSTLAFLVTKFFQPISDAWGMHVMFWIFAAVCIIGALFSLLVQPETKGKSFAEIQEKLNRGRKIKNSTQPQQ